MMKSARDAEKKQLFFFTQKKENIFAAHALKKTPFMISMSRTTNNET